MPIGVVRSEIGRAMRDNHLTEAEANRIRDAALDGYDFAVAKDLRDLFDRTNDGSVTARSPGAVTNATAESQAPTRLYGLLVATNTPVGNNYYVKQQLIHAMDFAPPKPANAPATDKMFSVDLGSGRTRDGEQSVTGFVDVANQQAWRRIDLRNDDGTARERWEGPYELPVLRGTHFNVRFARTQTSSPELAPEGPSRALVDRFARHWLADDRYRTRDFNDAAPAGVVGERFLLGLPGGVKDTLVMAEGDRSRIWVKRTQADGTFAFRGPLRADTFEPSAP